MERIETLAALFAKFPGIGERQSRRFVYYLLRQRPEYLERLATQIESIRNNVIECPFCFRFYEKQEGTPCTLCMKAEDKTILLVVEKDADLESLRKSGTYKGYYFVFGGSIPILEAPAPHVRIQELLTRIEKDKAVLTEVILAFSLTPAGDNTDEYVRRELKSILEGTSVRVTSLGRGLSTGTELEYSDAQTILYALKNRQ